MIKNHHIHWSDIIQVLNDIYIFLLGNMEDELSMLIKQNKINKTLTKYINKLTSTLI